MAEIVNKQHYHVNQALFKESDNFELTDTQRKSAPILVIKPERSEKEILKEHELLIKSGFKASYQKYQTYYRAG